MLESNVLKQVGLDGIDIGYIFIIVIILVILLVILYIIQIVKYIKLKDRLDKFMIGKKATSLEEDIEKLYNNNLEYKKDSEKNRKDIEELYKKNQIAFQKFGLIKYNAFKEMGGQLSFSLAMLNEKNDGYIINSVHSTDGCYTYTKEIKNAKSNLELGKEEQEALDMATK